EMLVEAAEKLRENGNIHFIITGEGAYKQTLEKVIAEKKLDSITLLPFQPYEDIAHVFSLGDVGLIISKPGIGGSSVPSKALSIMAAGRPILASFDEDSELVRMIKENGCGIAARADNLEEFIEMIRNLYDKKDKIDAIGRNGRFYVVQNCDARICTAQYTKILNTLQKAEKKICE
ncbi:MAG: glycosyltransferase, partial [Acinetobacter sp.]